MMKLCPGKMLRLLLLLPLALVACVGFDPTQIISTVETAASTAPAAEPSAAEPTGAALTGLPPTAETPILMCTPPACAPGESYTCPSGDCPGGCGTVCAAPTPITGPLAPAPTDWESLEGWLTALWQSHVDPAAVRAALQQSGMQRGYDDWRAADFDGDLQDDWVLVLYDQSLPATPFAAPGDLWIVNGNGVIFRYYAAPSSDIYNFIAPAIIAVSDLTGDRRPELITDAHSCGANTCFGNYRVIGQTASGLADLVRRAPVAENDPGDTISISYPEPRVEDMNGDGTAEFVVHGGLLGSAGAGIVRTRTEIWGWDGTAVTLAETRLDPTPYRHLVLYEANDRMAAGDLDGALALYEATINDPALVNEPFRYTPEQVYTDVSRFAAFRLVLIDLLQGNADRAAGRLAWLQANYPDAPVTQAAGQLIGGWTGPDGQAALCEQIEASLAATPDATGALADMGYGNPTLTVADMCP